ncbi:peptide chain release factor N(5)-glutamine methyltransferase [Patescibacteria group bacterium]|nr:MAG: peptide chain release factor N(5)-glutamine methyltransferase [Patescibacteria group bacterium]
MTVGEALRTRGIDPLDAELLLAHALRTTREHLLAHPEGRIRPAALRRFRALAARRRKHEPVALLLGHKHFYDLTLAVAPGVLIPRPETELLVETVRAMTAAGDAGPGLPPRARRSTAEWPSGRTRGVDGHGATIIDIGTGSGAIALTLAKHLPTARVIATDISPAALRLARKNARLLDLTRRVRFVKANLLPPRLAPDLIVANLPYLPTAIWRSAPPDVKRYEPRSALDGGRDGLDAYRALFVQIVARVWRCPIIIEIDPSQKKKLPAVVKRFFPKGRIDFKKDLSGRWRVALIRP